MQQIDAEFTVVEGPYARRKFWQFFTVLGGKVDEQGVSIGWKITKSTFRSMIDSALGLDPQDMSEAAKASRLLQGLSQMSGVTFIGKIKIEPSDNPRYPDRNRLDRVVLPNEPEWQKVMNGEHVPPAPSAQPRAAAKPAGDKPAWGQGTAAAPAASEACLGRRPDAITGATPRTWHGRRARSCTGPDICTSTCRLQTRPRLACQLRQSP